MSRKTPGLVTRGSVRGILEEGVGSSAHSNRVHANIFHGASINMIAGQKVVVRAGTQKMLRRLKYCSGEAYVMLPGHLGDP